MSSFTTVLLSLAILFTMWPNQAHAGIFVDARCPCGYQKKHMPLFGGRANYKTSCRFPALCLATREIILIDILNPIEKFQDCPNEKIIRYDDASLAPIEQSSLVTSWHLRGHNTTLCLYSGGYVCPRCGKHTLHFTQTGFWD